MEFHTEGTSPVLLRIHRRDLPPFILESAERRAEIISITEELEQCIPDPGQERSAESREIISALNGFLDTLPKDSRLIFIRRYWYADSVAAIAGRYDMTESKVKMQLLRTRNKLKDHLEKEGIQI